MPLEAEIWARRGANGPSRRGRGGGESEGSADVAEHAEDGLCPGKDCSRKARDSRGGRLQVAASRCDLRFFWEALFADPFIRVCLAAPLPGKCLDIVPCSFCSCSCFFYFCFWFLFSSCFYFIFVLILSFLSLSLSLFLVISSFLSCSRFCTPTLSLLPLVGGAAGRPNWSNMLEEVLRLRSPGGRPQVDVESMSNAKLERCAGHTRKSARPLRWIRLQKWICSRTGIGACASHIQGMRIMRDSMGQN